MTATLRIVRLSELAKLPTYATPGDAGLDLFAAIDKPLTMFLGCREVVTTGLVVQIPASYVGMVCPRSGLAAKHGITVLNAPGIVDSGYRGEVKVVLISHAWTPHKIQPGDRIAQLVIVPCVPVLPIDLTKPWFELEERMSVDELSASVRGTSGFGGSGA